MGTILTQPPNITLTQAIYDASLHPALLALRQGNYPFINNKNEPDTYNPSLASSLLTAAMHTGLPIDTQCVLWNWGAPITMAVREEDGYAWVPSYGMPNINVAPGLSPPAGVISNYTNVMPPGGIKVSTNAVDYPKWVDPNIPPPIVGWTVGPFAMQAVGSDGLIHYYFSPGTGQHPPQGLTFEYQGLWYNVTDLPSSFAIEGGIEMVFLMLVPAP